MAFSVLIAYNLKVKTDMSYVFVVPKKFDSWSENVISGHFRFISGEICAVKKISQAKIAPEMTFFRPRIVTFNM